MGKHIIAIIRFLAPVQPALLFSQFLSPIHGRISLLSLKVICRTFTLATPFYFFTLVIFRVISKNGSFILRLVSCWLTVNSLPSKSAITSVVFSNTFTLCLSVLALENWYTACVQKCNVLSFGGHTLNYGLLK
jgi:hypothetical protein